VEIVLDGCRDFPFPVCPRRRSSNIYWNAGVAAWRNHCSCNHHNHRTWPVQGGARQNVAVHNPHGTSPVCYCVVLLNQSFCHGAREHNCTTLIIVVKKLST
jgi:hypothetical protein